MKNKRKNKSRNFKSRKEINKEMKAGVDPNRCCGKCIWRSETGWCEGAKKRVSVNYLCWRYKKLSHVK